MDDLRTQRRAGDAIVVTLLWLHVPLTAVVGVCTQVNWVGLTAMTLALAAGVTILLKVGRDPGAARIAAGVALMGAISTLLASCRGQTWQVDIHMYYFAALALLSIYCDWRVIVGAAAAVALHHLLLNFLLPAAIYPGGGDIGRVLLHAVVLVVEAATLVWLTRHMSTLLITVRSSMEAAQAAQLTAEGALDDVREAQARNAALSEESATLSQRVQQEQSQVVAALAEGLSRLADGDLAQSLAEPFAGQYEALRHDYNAAVARLRGAVAEVAVKTGALRSGADEISFASNDLSRRTEQQAANLEETAAALDQITSTVTQAAANAERVRRMVGETRQDAERSGDVVERAVEAMAAIERSSHQISQIIGVMDEIAFQTNLLALNAGVEAARAGDAGRGFAVVASEVRALAQRSAEAAKEIKGLITSASAQVKAGVGLVDQTGASLKRIAAQVSGVDGAVDAIVASTREQASGLSVVNEAVNRMDQVTQQNAAMVEESTAAAASLRAETEQLEALVLRFRTDQPVQAGPARPRLYAVA